jgi:sugar (pentulose or hexulose) kinase
MGRGACTEAVDELGRGFGHEELHRRSGRGPSLTQAFPKILWLVQNKPQVAQRAYRFIDVHGYLVQRSAPFSHSTFRWPGTSRQPYYHQVD